MKSSNSLNVRFDSVRYFKKIKEIREKDAKCGGFIDEEGELT